MTGRHEGPPLGSAVREATASPYPGKRRALDGAAIMAQIRADNEAAWTAARAWSEPEPDDPPRCWSCGHPFDAGCECSCCNDDHDGGPDDV